MDLIRDFFTGRPGKAGPTTTLDAVDASVMNPMSELQVLEHHEDIVRCLCRVGPQSSPSLLASGGDDGTVVIWDHQAGRRIAVLREHTLAINDLLALSPTLLASASTDKTIRIWNLMTFQCAHVLRAHQGSVKCLALLSDGRFASGGNDRTLCIWTSTGEGVASIARPEEEILHCLLALPNGRLVTGSNSSKIMVYNTQKSKHEAELSGHRESVRCLAALQNGSIFASASLDGAIIVWNADTLASLRTLNLQEKIRNDAKNYQWSVRRLVPLGEKYLAAAISSSLVVYDALNGSPVMQVRNAHEAELVDIAPLYDGACLVTCAADASIRLWSNRQAFNFLLDRAHDTTGTVTINSPTLSSTAHPPSTPSPAAAANANVSHQQYRSLASLLKKSGLSRLEPIYFGEMLAHSYSVNRLLPLSATSVASCGSDGLVVLWKDGRHQSALRSRIAATHLAAQSVLDDADNGGEEERWPS